MSIRIRNRIYPACVVLLLSTGAANAFDAKASVDNYIDLAKQQGIEITYDNLQALGTDGFQLQKIKMRAPNVPNPFYLESIKVEGVEELQNGNFAAENVEATNFLFESVTELGEPISVSVDSMNFGNAYYANPKDENAPFYHYPQSSFEATGLKVVLSNKDVVKSGSISGKNNVDEATGVMHSIGSMNKMIVDLTAIDNPVFSARRQEFGYDQLTLGIKFAGSWNMKTGRVEISEYSIGADEAGELNLTGKLSGLTESLVRQFRKLSVEIQNQPLDEQAQAQQGIQMMALAAGLVFEGMTIRYDDRSLVGKVLDYQAKQMGKTRGDLAQMVPALVPVMTARLGNPEFSALVGNAVATFLANPGSFTITASPIQSVPFMQLVIAGSSAPQTLINLLNLQVVANQ